MITIVKKTPITFKGEDCMEVLVHDDNINDCRCCLLCMYRDFEIDNELMATCMDIHGCPADCSQYFIKQPL